MTIKGLVARTVVTMMLVTAGLVGATGVAQAWARGLSIDCGCLGGGGAVDPGDTAYGRELLRDAGFLLMAGWLMARPRTLGVLSLPSRQKEGV